MSNTAQSKQGKNPAASPDVKTAETAQKAAYSAKDAARMPAWTSAWGDRPPVSLTDPLADLQAKYIVNQPGDAYEQEADDVADQVMQRDTSGTLGVSPLIA